MKARRTRDADFAAPKTGKRGVKFTVLCARCPYVRIPVSGFFTPQKNKLLEKLFLLRN